MEAILYQSGIACRIYLLADGSNCPSETFLTTALRWKKAYETARKANKLKFTGDNE